jgi:hypothetical protein
VLRDESCHGCDDPRAVGAGNGQGVVAGHAALSEIRSGDFNG